MQRAKWILAGSLVAVSAGVMIWREPPSPAPVAQPRPEQAQQPAAPKPERAPAPAEFPAPSSLPDGTELTPAQQAKVEGYLELEETRQSIQDYFDAPQEQADRADEVWRSIAQLERDGRVMGFEAMHMKLAWLSVNSPDEATYEESAEALVKEYSERARAAQKAYRPEDIPGYTDYKAREAQIIAEVKSMDSFPQGQTRQQYLRERLLQARMEAYGETGEQAPPR